MMQNNTSDKVKPLFGSNFTPQKGISAVKESVPTVVSADQFNSFQNDAFSVAISKPANQEVAPMKTPSSVPSTSIAFAMSQDDISNFGADIQQNVSNFTDSILQNVKTQNTGEIGDGLVKIVNTARQFNISDLNQTSSNVPFIGKFIDKIKASRNNVESKFNSLSDQIEHVVKELDTAVVGLQARNNVLEEVYVNNMAEFKDLENIIHSGKSLLETENARYAQQLATFQASGEISPEKNQLFSDWNASIKRFEKRLYDLESIKAMALQTMPEIRLIQNNNRMLIEKFNTAKTLTIPQWKKQFIIGVALNEQKVATQLANTVDNATNEFYKKNAELLGQNSIESAKINQRAIIDIESLEFMHNTLINTFSELTKIEAEGQEKRKQNSKKLEEMSKDLHAKLVSNKKK